MKAGKVLVIECWLRVLGFVSVLRFFVCLFVCCFVCCGLFHYGGGGGEGVGGGLSVDGFCLVVVVVVVVVCVCVCVLSFVLLCSFVCWLVGFVCVYAYCCFLGGKPPFHQEDGSIG